MGKDLNKLIKDCRFDPTAIGIEILRGRGFIVKVFEYSSDIYVYDETGEELLYKYVDSDYYHE